VVYQDHEDEKNSSEFFEANALLSQISRWISSPISHADGIPAAPKSVLIEMILPNTQEKMGAGITLYPKSIHFGA